MFGAPLRDLLVRDGRLHPVGCAALQRRLFQESERRGRRLRSDAEEEGAILEGGQQTVERRADIGRWGLRVWFPQGCDEGGQRLSIGIT